MKAVKTYVPVDGEMVHDGYFIYEFGEHIKWVDKDSVDGVY